MAERVTIPELVSRKRNGGKKISMVTAYDAGQAALVDEAGVDAILVGDSAANVIHGHETTIPVTLDEMVMHTRAAARGRKRALLVGDMPFMSYQAEIADAVRAAGRFLKEGFADCVKLEGGIEMAPTVRALVRAQVPVMGHVGLTPQSVHMFGGHKVQGKDAERAKEILDGARALEDAGAFAIVLECVPTAVAQMVTNAVSVPTIGIGAGPFCDGQVLVFHDLLGLTRRRLPRFVKRYEALADKAVIAIRSFREDVEAGKFPTAEHGYGIDEQELERLKSAARAQAAESPALPGPVSGTGTGTGTGTNEAAERLY
jgi:3-methyl-2-oxobutanoate hydroxymethyltransferase